MKYDLLISERNIENGIKNLENLIEGGDISFRQLKASLESIFDGAWDEWHTPAGLAFRNKFKNELIKGIDDYIAVLEVLVKDLKLAQFSYSQVYDAADELKRADYPDP